MPSARCGSAAGPCGWGVRSTDPDMITVIGTDSRLVHLLVIRPEVPGGTARAVLRSAADGDSTATAAEILFGNGVPSGAETADPLESMP